MLSPEELERYSRHTLLPEVGLAGQERLKAASVLVIGAGGLGSPVALYLAAAGIGRMGLVDDDVVDLSNLQRQILHDTGRVGESKLDSAKTRLLAINPHLELTLYPTRLNASNAEEIFGPYDIIVDGTDNFATRYLVNDACVMLGKPNAYGSIFRFEGQASFFHAAEGPCYRCLFPEPPAAGTVPSCAEGGVFGVLPGVIGSIQATEVIKFITGIGSTLLGRLLLYNALEMSFREIRLRKNPDCPVCGENPTITRLTNEPEVCDTMVMNVKEISVAELKALRDSGDCPQVLDVREDNEVAVSQMGADIHIPLGEIPSRIGELDPTKRLIIHCKMGGRSAQACMFLQSQGFVDVTNVAGGIMAWKRLEQA